ncbi:PLP-dependent aminotransferase family protein [Sphaerisporangium aureirubrum]|uniref:Serine hydroxymethyltransferase-like domain-containing protein n=1 Tax=Sphaerisporangium aureirubrum TaxID=1544736 RepID=A0ABW1NAU0_9ACTN
MSHPVVTLDDVLRILTDNETHAARTLNMVPSENAMSGLAKLPLLLDCYHRYFFNEGDHSDRWHFRGAQRLRELEMGLTVPLLEELGRARYVTVRPLSGLNAMTLALATLGGEPGSTVVTVDPCNGGHYATPSVARRLGLRVEFLLGQDPHDLDFDHAADLLRRVRPALVYVDQSHCLFPIDVARLVDVVRAASPSTLVHVDASHWFGLVLAGVIPNPLDAGADSFGGSTHKTFPGPQKAVLLTRDHDIERRIRHTQDYLISSHHLAATISLGIALLEFRDHGGADYARAVVANTKTFGRLLSERGTTVVAADRGYSAGHQLWLDTAADGVAPKLASDRLARAGITVNFMDGLPGFAGQGVRIGLNEPTYRGVTAADLPELADVFTLALRDAAPADMLADRTARLRDRPRLGAPVHDDTPLLSLAMELAAGALRSRPAVLEPA